MLRPEEAIVLCAFDGRRSLRDVISFVAVVGDTAFETAEAIVRNVMRRVAPDYQVFVRARERRHHRPFDPNDYVIPSREVKLDVRLQAPLTMMLQPTPECQTDCVYCYACRRSLKRGDLLTSERIRDLLDEAAELGIYQINLCGGDGFCRGDFPEIIKACLAKEMIVDISTKCFIDRETAEDLAAAGLDYMQVSIDSSREDIANLMYGRQGHFPRVVATIKNFIAAGIFTRTNSIVTPHNFDHIGETIEFLASIGVTEMKLTPAFRSYFRDNRDCMISPDMKSEFKRTMAGLEAEYRTAGIRLFYDSMRDFTEMDDAERKEYWFSRRPRCSAGRCSMVITPDGKVVPCEEAPQEERFFMGDLKTQTIREVWESQRFLDFTYPAQETFASETCRRCDAFKTCAHVMGHCFKDCLKVYGTVFDTNPFCPKAPRTENRIY